jgi:hypothetical protein
MARKERLTPVQAGVLRLPAPRGGEAYFLTGHRVRACREGPRDHAVETNTVTLHVLRQRGLIEPVQTGRPNDDQGRYRITDAGRAAVA